MTIAKEVDLKDPVENLGAQMLRQAAVNTGEALVTLDARPARWAIAGIDMRELLSSAVSSSRRDQFE